MLGMSTKRVLMCRPEFFEISYSINAWMDINNPVDKAKAQEQWQTLVDVYKSLEIEVDTIDPIKGLPDMVFATDNGLAIGNKVVLGRFLYTERQGETNYYKHWLESHGYETLLPSTVFEGGDDRVIGDTVFIGYGFRTARGSHGEIAKFLGKNVVSLHLIDKRFYHLDTAFCPIDNDTAMYFPAAFDEPSQQLIKQHFPILIEASEQDALAFGLNAISDGHNVVISSHATDLIQNLKTRNYNPIPVDISEFQKSGGGIKCLTMELIK